MIKSSIFKDEKTLMVWLVGQFKAYEYRLSTEAFFAKVAKELMAELPEKIKEPKHRGYQPKASISTTPPQSGSGMPKKAGFKKKKAK